MRWLAALLTVGSVWSAPAQVAPPDVRGQWACVGCQQESPDTELRPAFGEAPSITIEPMLVTVTFDYPAQGRGGHEERTAHLEFALSGEKSNQVMIASGSSRTHLWDVTTLEQGRLVVETFESTGYVPAHKTQRRELFIDQEGQLVVETRRLTAGRPDDPLPQPVRTVYRRRVQ